MKNFFDSEFFKSLFKKEDADYKKAKEDVLKNREDTKENLAMNLREKLFFTEEEILQVTNIIDKEYEKIDYIQKTTDFKNYDIKPFIKFDNELSNLQNEMKNNVQNKIKEIIQLKIQKAKENYNKNQDENPFA